MPVSAETYERVALEDREQKWELVCGRLRAKPAMTTEHNEAPRSLLSQIVAQVSRQEYSVAENSGRLRVANGSYYVPDLCVIPRAMVRKLREVPGTFEVYDDPIPLVVEVWSPSTGDYDVDEKLPEYRQRGDAEIWRIHPYERTLTRWVRQSDGSYVETLLRATGAVTLAAIPAVTIDLDALFE